jgi:hypothetical protein
MCEAIGICIVVTTTTTDFMAGTDGSGVDIAVLVSTSTACAPCTAIIKATGDGFERIGISGEGNIITSDLDGFGGIPTEGWDGICTG